MPSDADILESLVAQYNDIVSGRTPGSQTDRPVILAKLAALATKKKIPSGGAPFYGLERYLADSEYSRTNMWDRLGQDAVDHPDKNIDNYKVNNVHPTVAFRVAIDELREAVNGSSVGAPSEHAGYTVAAVLEMTGASDATFNTYAKRAGVPTPARGKRNHRYSAAQVRIVLELLINASSSRRLISQCRDAMRRLGNPK